jgi:Cu-Zn family superoxide dismutase
MSLSRAVVPVVLLLAAPLARAAETSARARLLDATGKQVGNATLEPTDGGTKVTLIVTGFKPGKHGFHIHAVGKCEAPDFKSAGPHFNPTGKKHGLESPQGAHAGDLPNLNVADDGAGSATNVAKGVKLDALFAGDGTALVIHADPDDGKTDPAGNSGARVACGVIERS